MDDATFQKGCPADYRLTFPLTEIPPAHPDSRLVEPHVGRSHGLVAPSMPGEMCFYDEYEELLAVRELVKQNIWPADFLAKHHPSADFDPERIPEPLKLFPAVIATSDPRRAAGAVEMDLMTDMPELAIQWLNSKGVPLDRPRTSHVNFLQRTLKPLDSIVNKQLRDGKECFEAKYYFGRPRPEEIDPVRFGDADTHNPARGCPCHPSYPAGHGTFAGTVKVLTYRYDLSEAHKRELFDTAYHWSQYRTFAGYHYATDNLAGLTLAGYNYWGLRE